MVNNEINAICSENQSDKSNLLKYESARIYIKFSRSNTIINLTDINGNSILCVSAGSLGFNGARKASLFAAKASAEVVAKKAIELGCKHIVYFVKGDREDYQDVIQVFHQFGLCLSKSDNLKKKL